MKKISHATSAASRRRFLKVVPAAVAAGLAAPALAQQAQEQPPRIGKETLDCAEKIFGVDFTDAEEEQAMRGVSRNLDSYEQLRKIDIPLDTEPALTFRPYLPGKKPKAWRYAWREDQGHASAAGGRVRPHWTTSHSCR